MEKLDGETVSDEFIVMHGDASPILEAARTALDGPRKLPCGAECFSQFDLLATNRPDSIVFEEAAKRAPAAACAMGPAMGRPSTKMSRRRRPHLA